MTDAVTSPFPPEAPRDCPLCPRLVEYRLENARRNPDWYNGAARSFGDPQARLLIAGLAVKEGREAWRGEGCCVSDPLGGAGLSEAGGDNASFAADARDDCCSHG